MGVDLRNLNANTSANTSANVNVNADANVNVPVAVEPAPNAVAKEGRFSFAKMKADFLATNAGLGLDFVTLASWLYIDGKGCFYNKDSEEVYGDKLNVVIGGGQERYTMWGKEGTAQAQTCVITADTREQAEIMFNKLAAEDDKFDASQYTYEDIKEGYIAQLVTEKSMGSDMPEILVYAMPVTAKYNFKAFVAKLFKGQYPGFKKGTSATAVIIQMTTVSKKFGANKKYTTVEFSPVRYI